MNADDYLAAKTDPDLLWDGEVNDYADPELRARGAIDQTIGAGYADVILRKGDVAERLREQVTQPPLNPLGLRLLLDWAADTIERLQARYATPSVPAKPLTTQAESSRFDPLGRTLTVDDHQVGSDRIVRMRVESDTRLHVQAFELDADDAIQLAHELLERAYPQADCDEVETAIVALRRLADRESAFVQTGIEMQGLDR